MGRDDVFTISVPHKQGLEGPGHQYAEQALEPLVEPPLGRAGALNQYRPADHITDHGYTDQHRQTPASRLSTTSADEIIDLSDQVIDLSDHVIKTEEYSVGGGRFGDVYIGIRIDLSIPESERRVAIKVVRSVTARKDLIKKVTKRLQREIFVWQCLAHDNILPFLGISNKFGRLPALISPWMENGQLNEFLATHPEANKKKMVHGIAKGLRYLHTREPHITHGDVKTANTLVDREGNPRLSDFGLSRMLSEDYIWKTTTVNARGSLRWMAPELILESDILPTLESDVYAFAMTVLEIITGNVPYHRYHQDPAVIAALSRNELPDRPSQLTDNNWRLRHDDIWKCMLRCWNRHPKTRPRMDDIEELFQKSNGSDPAPPVIGPIAGIPRNVSSKAGSPVTFGSLDRPSAPLSSNPAQAPSLPQEGAPNVQSFGSIPSTSVQQPRAPAVNGIPPVPAANAESNSIPLRPSSSSPATTGAKQKLKFDTKELKELFEEVGQQSQAPAIPSFSQPVPQQAQQTPLPPPSPAPPMIGQIAGLPMQQLPRQPIPSHQQQPLRQQFAPYFPVTSTRPLAREGPGRQSTHSPHLALRPPPDSPLSPVESPPLSVSSRSTPNLTPPSPTSPVQSRSAPTFVPRPRAVIMIKDSEILPTSVNREKKGLSVVREETGNDKSSATDGTYASHWHTVRAVNESSPDYLDINVKRLLDQLTSEQFDLISDQIIHWVNKSENETDGRTLRRVVQLVYEKAIDVVIWSEMYACLCRKMIENVSPGIVDESIRTNDGKPLPGGQLFRKYLLNRCQEDFERGWAHKEAASAAAAAAKADDDTKANAAEQNGEEALHSDEYCVAQKAKRQGLGLAKFIGELFKLRILTERIMHGCIKKLLSNVDYPVEEELESLCKLLETVGEQLDNAKAQKHMDVYFTRMKELSQSPMITSRVKYALQDVIELRERKWRARTNVAAPSLIAHDSESESEWEWE